MMELMDQELEAEVFVWDADDAVAQAEPSADTAPVEPVILRSTALEALDAPVQEDGASLRENDAAVIAALDVDVASDAAGDFAAVDPHAFADTGNAEETLSPVAMDAPGAEGETAQNGMDLFNEKFPDGMQHLFEQGLSQGLFALVWGDGPVSGSPEWTDADFQLLDAIFMKLEEQGIDPVELWEDFTTDLADSLFPDGYSPDALADAYDANGPISGLAEWTELDFQAMDLVTSMLEDFEGDAQDDLALDTFNEAYPDGILTLFPDGYSDAAFDELAWGNGLVSGETEWTEEDELAFEGLWQALLADGIEPYRDDFDFEDMPIVIDDGDFCPMPIVIDDGSWPDKPDCFGPVGCELMPPPVPVICPFPPDDMAVI